MWRWAILLLGLTTPALAAPPGRLALVIGDSTYPTLPTLAACAASASVVSAALKRAGFAVTELTDASNGQMGAAISEFGDGLAQSPGAQAVLYVCGYAVGFDGRVFLLPSSARLERNTDVLTQGLIARLPVTTVTGAELRGGLVLLDLVAPPGSGPLPLAAGAAADTKGVVSVVSRVTPAGTSVLAGAFAAELGASDVELGPLVEKLRKALQGTAGIEVAAQGPARPAWLVGGAAPAPAAAPEPSPAPAPAVVAAPTPPAPPPEPSSQPAAAGTSVAPSSPAALNEADRRRMQLALQRLGYYAGHVDGQFGPESLAAIRRFQHELGTEMTGRLTVEQAARLLQDSR